jgi:hypothetical protein
MSAHGPVAAGGMNGPEMVQDLAAKIPGRPSPRTLLFFTVLVLIGVVAFVATVISSPLRAWGAFLVNTVFWTGVGASGVVLASAIRLSNGRWASGASRVAESLASFLPVALVLLLVMFSFGAPVVLPWVRNPNPARAPYLNLPFLFVRTLGGFLLLWWLQRAYVRTSLRTDAYRLKDHVVAELRPYYEKLSAGWRGASAEEAWQRHRLSKLAPAVVGAYAVVFTLFAWDWIMTLDQHWISTLFGWWVFMGAFLSGVAMTAVLLARVRAVYRLEAYISTQQFWDMGKLVFAFSIFWLYQFWSQYLVIWYGNLPEETAFFRGRLGSQFLMDKSGFGTMFLAQTWDLKYFAERLREPYAVVTLTVWACCWIVPFWVLLGQRPKRTPAILGTVGAVVMAGFWLERNILIWPSLVPNETFSWLGFVQIGIAAGFLGAFALVFLAFTCVFPSLAVPRRS